MNKVFNAFNSDDYYRVLNVLLLLTLVMVMVGIGFRSPWPADEPRFAEVAREMVSSGQWLFPMRGGEFYPDKPPVFMWSIALFYWLTGSLKLSFLLPNALCGLLTVFLVYDLGARLWNVRAGRNAALLLLLVPQFLIQAKSAQIDAMVMCWITIGCYGLIRHFFTGPAWGWYFTAWGFMGLGVITKGVGFLPALMMLPIIFYGFRNKELFAGRLGWRCWLGLPVLFAVIACWLVPMVLTVQSQATPDLLAYQNNILFKQTGERYANAWHHIKPWHYYLSSVIPWLWFPLPFLIAAGWKPMVARIKAEPVLAVLLAWVALVVLFFSISPGKRNVYILPALPMLALATAGALQGVSPARWFERLITGLLGLIALVFGAVGVLALIAHPAVAKKLAHYPEALQPLGLLALTLAVVWIVLLFALRKSPAMLRMGACSALTWLLVSTWGYSVMEPARTPKAVLANVDRTMPGGAELGLISFKEQFILFSPRAVTHFSYLSPQQEQERNAWLWMSEMPNRYLLVPDSAKLQCFDMANAKDMGEAHRTNWMLLDKNTMSHQCDEPERIRRYFTPRPKWMD